MQNLENLDVFEILITQNLLKCRKDPLSDPRSYLCRNLLLVCKDVTSLCKIVTSVCNNVTTVCKNWTCM